MALKKFSGDSDAWLGIGIVSLPNLGVPKVISFDIVDQTHFHWM